MRVIQPVRQLGERAATKRASGVVDTTRAELQLDHGLLESVPAKDMRPRTRRTLGRRVADWLWCRPVPCAEPAWIGPVEDPPDTARGGKPRIGICCSGGGIRSAAFNLGALQTLQEQGKLRESRYLAAVSGGSYIAAGFAMVAKTAPGREDTDDSEPEDTDDSDPNLVNAAAPAFHRGSPEEQYLRNHSSYMAPTGLDKAFLGFRMLLGLLWNLLLLELFIFPVAIAASYLYWHGFRDLSREPPDVDMPTLAVAIPVVIGAIAVAVGVIYLLISFPSDRWRNLTQTWAMRLVIAGIVTAFLLIAVPYLLREFLIHGAAKGADNTAGKPVGFAGWASLATIAVGLASQLSRLRGAADVLGGKLRLRTKVSNGLRRALAYAAAAIAVPLLALIGFLLPMAWSLAAASTVEFNPKPVYIGAGALAAFAFFYVVADLTNWSLHPFYKRRLATAFALKRVKGVGPQGDTRGRAVPRDYDKLPTIRSADVSTDESPFPTLVVCAAANVSDEGATPPGRRVTSFTFSPGAIGGPLVGAVTPAEYERGMGQGRARSDVGLLTAVAVSGAALSPSMGKETRWALRALMALANIRLGVWVRNPRYLRATGVYPRPRPQHLLFEILGRSPVDGKYLYVTDGGHYENLGLVELLRRGCTEIYCFDASGGDGNEALGDAIALARSELEVKIDIDVSELVPEDGMGYARNDVALGRIEYRNEKEQQKPVVGRLVYARTALTNQAPYDVKAFHDVDPLFPHHPTTDQLYTDQKFEAYRALGARAATSALATVAADDLKLTPLDGDGDADVIPETIERAESTPRSSAKRLRVPAG